MRTITIWENDTTGTIDPIIQIFIDKHYKGCNIVLMSGFDNRTNDEILESVRDSYAIVMEPTVLRNYQINDIAQLISHPIHLNTTNNPARPYDIQKFIFLSTNPWDTLQTIVRTLKNTKDNHNEYSLMKILKHCRVEFYSTKNDDQYELERDGVWDTKAIRIN